MNEQNTNQQPTLEFRDVTFYYRDAGRQNNILNQANYAFQPGRLYTILGPSGTGKTTVLMLASALDMPKSGQVLFSGKKIRELGTTHYRNQHVSMIFQSYNLIPYMNALQNVMTAMSITKVASANRRERALEMLKHVGLDPHQCLRNINRLSGGQQQRVAIARAVACDVDLILADEPTGNLDQETAQDIIALFSTLAHQQNKCVIVVTHSQDLAQKADHVLHLKNGRFSA